VRGKTTNGGVQVQLGGQGWQGNGLDLETHNGGVHVSVPDGYSAHLDAGTKNGRVGCDLPIAASDPKGKELVGDLGQGGAPVKIRTVNGGVSVVKR
jgi:DUF4097 and DUF4098 domain-containing protein YvlB